MALKVGRIPTLDCEPSYFDMERRGIELHDMMPNALATAVEKGEIDAGPVPLVEWFRMEDRFQPLAGFCTASIRKAGSSVLYSERPIENLTGARIGAGDRDPTSLRLLRVLLSLKHQVQPESYTTMEEPYEAFLLTGNQALRHRRGARGYPHRYDLGEEWHEWTGLPFVFFRWLARRDMDPKEIVLLEDTLYVGHEQWFNNLYLMSGPRDDLRMLPKDILEHVQGLRYFIGVQEERAMALFREKLALLEDDSS